ncbi:hypothetical protein E4U32_002832, partial [Claviceps aff. humidiphila group G2b]
GRAQDFPKARDCLEELKRVGKNGQPRRRERLTRERAMSGRKQSRAEDKTHYEEQKCKLERKTYPLREAGFSSKSKNIPKQA